ncbi:MAG: GTP pyrophosphokinase family protein [Oscillospiraceae bacterium]|nr:GTP pyrophosphokinase family protein [Oscillospiraceae bacterium]
MDEKEFYLETIKKIPSFENKTASDVFFEFLQLQHLYDSAIETVKTQLNILDNEFSVKFKRNPIHNIESRLKSPQSIIGKLNKKGLPLTTEAAKKNLLDMAGIRVICYYVNDIYSIAELLTCHDEFVPIKIKDYISNPKASGYRSYHMILNIPVYLSNAKQYAPVEIQIRTIAMDFWASLEHQLKYKTGNTVSQELAEELKKCADTISETDIKMQNIFNQLNELD